MSLILRLNGERDGSTCDVTGYSLAELRSSGCEYLRSFLDFGTPSSIVPKRPDGNKEEADTNDAPAVLTMHTGICRAALAAAVLHFLLQGPVEAPLEVDGSNAAELLSLADLWCLDTVKEHVLASLRKGPCAGFRRPTGGTTAVEAVPQVAVLARQALDYGIGDADGGLQRLYDDCTTWLASWAARAWPTRTFANLQRFVQEDVLAATKARVDVDSAPAVLSACRQLSGVPSVAWARRIEEMRGELTSYTLSYIWSNFSEICARAGLRQDRSECWGALLEELRNHVAEHPDPDAAVRLLPCWASITQALLCGAPPAAIAPQWGSGPLVAAVAAAAVRGSSGSSWLGEDEASQMQDLYEMVRNYCVRHLPLVARSAAFRALPPPEQQSILLIAQEGICARFAAGASQPRSPLQSPMTSAEAPTPPPQLHSGAAGGGARSNASWMIPLGDTFSIPKRPGRPTSSSASATMTAAAAAGAAQISARPSAAARRSATSIPQAVGSSPGEAAGGTAAAAGPSRPRSRSVAVGAVGVAGSSSGAAPPTASRLPAVETVEVVGLAPPWVSKGRPSSSSIVPGPESQRSASATGATGSGLDNGSSPGPRTGDGEGATPNVVAATPVLVAVAVESMTPTAVTAVEDEEAAAMAAADEEVEVAAPAATVEEVEAAAPAAVAEEEEAEGSNGVTDSAAAERLTRVGAQLLDEASAIAISKGGPEQPERTEARPVLTDAAQELCSRESGCGGNSSSTGGDGAKNSAEDPVPARTDEPPAEIEGAEEKGAVTDSGGGGGGAEEKDGHEAHAAAAEPGGVEGRVEKVVSEQHDDNDDDAPRQGLEAEAEAEGARDGVEDEGKKGMTGGEVRTVGVAAAEAQIEAEEEAEAMEAAAKGAVAAEEADDREALTVAEEAVAAEGQEAVAAEEASGGERTDADATTELSWLARVPSENLASLARQADVGTSAEAVAGTLLLQPSAAAAAAAVPLRSCIAEVVVGAVVFGSASSGPILTPPPLLPPLLPLLQGPTSPGGAPDVDKAVVLPPQSEDHEAADGGDFPDPLSRGGICAPQPPTPVRREGFGPAGCRPTVVRDTDSEGDACRGSSGGADGGGEDGMNEGTTAAAAETADALRTEAMACRCEEMDRSSDADICIHVGDSAHDDGLGSNEASASIAVAAEEMPSATAEAVRRPASAPASAVHGNPRQRPGAAAVASGRPATAGGGGRGRLSLSGAFVTSSDSAKRVSVMYAETKSSAARNSRVVPAAAAADLAVHVSRTGSGSKQADGGRRPRAHTTSTADLAATAAAAATPAATVPSPRAARNTIAVARPTAAKSDPAAAAAPAAIDTGGSSRTPTAVALRRGAPAATATTTTATGTATAGTRATAAAAGVGGSSVETLKGASRRAAGVAEAVAPGGSYSTARQQKGATATRPVAAIGAKTTKLRPAPPPPPAPPHSRLSETKVATSVAVTASLRPAAAATTVTTVRRSAAAATTTTTAAATTATGRSIYMQQRPAAVSARARTSSCAAAVSSAASIGEGRGKGLHAEAKEGCGEPDCGTDKDCDQGREAVHGTGGGGGTECPSPPASSLHATASRDRFACSPS